MSQTALPTAPTASRRTRNWGIVLLIVIVLGLGWLRFIRQPMDQANAAPEIGFLAPDFSLPGLDGKEYQLSAFRGKPVILNFWATWCVPCRIEMPAFEQVWQRYNQNDVIILAVNQRENAATIEQFKQQVANVTFPILLDANNDVNRRYLIRGLPTTFFIDAEGRIQTVSLGGLNEATLLASVQKILPPLKEDK